jgi:hypothetical protein
MAAVSGTTVAHPLQNTNKSSASNSDKSAVSGISRTASKASRSNVVQSGGLAVPGGALGQLVDGATGVRQQAELLKAAEQEVGSKPAAADSRSAETFAALDAQGAPGRPAWIHTGAQQAEAGFQDPALGWVGVRADASGGGIHAQLVAGSADAAQALSGEMAGLSSFLAEHHTPVETLTLSSSGGMGGTSNQDAGGGMQQGAGDQAGQQAAQNARAESSSILPSSRATVAEAVLSKPVWQVGAEDGAMRAQWVGGHISVMA